MMSDSNSGSDRGQTGRSFRELELELAKARAEAAQLLARAHALEAELEREKRAQSDREQERVVPAGDASSALPEKVAAVPPQLYAPQPDIQEPEPRKPPVLRSTPGPIPPSPDEQPPEQPSDRKLSRSARREEIKKRRQAAKAAAVATATATATAATVAATEMPAPQQINPSPPVPDAPAAATSLPSGGVKVEHTASASAQVPSIPAATVPVVAQNPVAAQNPAVAENVEDAAGDSPDEEKSKRRRFLVISWLHDLPGWLVSAIFHAALMLVLGLLTIAVVDEEERDRVLIAHIDAEEVDSFEDSALEDSLEDVELEQSDAISIDIQDPGLAALGDVSSMESESTVDVNGMMAMPETIGDIGAMFGEDGKGWTTTDNGMGGAAEFFGVKASGNRFIFVVDGSKSMARANKWEECKRELMVAMSKLKKNQRFYVFLFAKDIYRMFGENDPTEKMMLATPENIERLRYWLYDYELQLGTVPHKALVEALEEMRPSAIYLLSDGQFTDNGRSEKYLLDFAKEKNNIEDTETGHVFRVAVHTIAFHSKQGETVLKGVSDSFGSTFRYVPGAAGGGKGKNKKKKAGMPQPPGVPVPNPR